MAGKWVDLAPFRVWCDERLGDGMLPCDLAEELGITERRLYRWRFEAGKVAAIDMADALHLAGTALWEVYGFDVLEIELEPDGWCEGCCERVTPIGGVCPWCEGRVGRLELERAA